MDEPPTVIGIDPGDPRDAMGKEIVKQTSPALTVLIDPSAEGFCKGLDSLKERLAQAEAECQKNNLEVHLHRVAKTIRTQPREHTEKAATLASLKKFQKWAEGAQEVDPEDKALSSIWEQLLVGMARGGDIEQILIEKLKQLSPSDAEVLLRFREQAYWYPIGEKNRFHVRRLRDAGLVHRRYEPKFAATVVVVTVLGVCLGPLRWLGRLMETNDSSPYLHRALDEFSVHQVTGLTPVLLVSVAFLSLLLITALAAYGSNHWTLTWIGRDLLKYAHPKQPAVK